MSMAMLSPGLDGIGEGTTRLPCVGASGPSLRTLGIRLGPSYSSVYAWNDEPPLQVELHLLDPGMAHHCRMQLNDELVVQSFRYTSFGLVHQACGLRSKLKP